MSGDNRAYVLGDIVKMIYLVDMHTNNMSPFSLIVMADPKK